MVGAVNNFLVLQQQTGCPQAKNKINNNALLLTEDVVSGCNQNQNSDNKKLNLNNKVLKFENQNVTTQNVFVTILNEKFGKGSLK